MRLGLSLAVGCLIALRGAVGVQGVAPQTNLREVHVAVQLRSENGDPVGDLEAKDFRLLAAGAAPLAVQVSQPLEGAHRQAAGVPTRLLVVLVTADPAVREIVASKLGKVWKAGWSVSVLDAQGRQSAYTSSAAELRQAMAGIEKRRLVASAVHQLTQFAGRRVVFAVTQPGVALTGLTMRTVMQTGVSLYHVGGNPLMQQSSYESESASPPYTNANTGSVIGGVVISGGLATYRMRGRETEERGFGGAEEDALNDANGYYDLKVAVPAGVQEIKLGVKAREHGKDVHYVYAEPYEDGGAPPSVKVMNGKAWNGW